MVGYNHAHDVHDLMYTNRDKNSLMKASISLLHLSQQALLGAPPLEVVTGCVRNFYLGLSQLLMDLFRRVPLLTAMLMALMHTKVYKVFKIAT